MNGIENRAGALYFDGVNLEMLARTYGTPLYVMSETILRERCREIKRDFLDKYDNTAAVFASKAFQTLEMSRLADSEGLGTDVVSGGELFCALKAGVNPEKIEFHGNSKTIAEMEYAVDEGVGRFISDSLYEVRALERIAGERNKKVRVLYRMSPGVDSHTHRFISTGGLDSKFGIPLARSVRDEYMRAVLDAPHIDFRGFHFHVGSQLLENTSHVAAVDILLQFISEIRQDYHFETKEINVGGGYGISYLPSMQAPTLSYFLDPMMEKITTYYAALGLPRPLVSIESGRYITGEAGLTLYTVGSIKEIPGVRSYIGVDGGMTDNIRAALYGAKYYAALAGKASAPVSGNYTIAGKCCESGDILIEDIPLPAPESGDILAVFSTGAYHYSMASNYNRLPKPAVVMVREGRHRLSVRRETYNDMLAQEC